MKKSKCSFKQNSQIKRRCVFRFEIILLSRRNAESNGRRYWHERIINYHLVVWEGKQVCLCLCKENWWGWLWRKRHCSAECNARCAIQCDQTKLPPLTSHVSTSAVRGAEESVSVQLVDRGGARRQGNKAITKQSNAASPPLTTVARHYTPPHLPSLHSCK